MSITILCKEKEFIVTHDHKICQSDYFRATLSLCNNQKTISLHQFPSHFFDLLIDNPENYYLLSLTELAQYCRFLDFILYNDEAYVKNIYWSIGQKIEETADLTCVTILDSLLYYVVKIYPSCLLFYDLPCDPEYKQQILSQPNKYLSVYKYQKTQSTHCRADLANLATYCTAGNLPIIKYLITDTSPKSEIQFALRLVCHFGHLDLLIYLLQFGNEIVSDLLKIAVRACHTNFVQYLLCNYEFETKTYNKCAKIACQQGNHNLVNLFLSCNMSNHQECCEISCEGNNLEIVSTLYNTGKIDINTDEQWCLFAACEYGQVEIVKFLLDTGDIEHISDEIQYSYCYSPEILELLLPYGMHLNETVLRIACLDRKADVVKFLLEHHIHVSYTLFDECCQMMFPRKH